MWSLWFVPLVFAAFIVGGVIGFGALIVRRRQSGRWLDRRGLTLLVGAPLGCAMLPIVAVLTLIGLNGVMQTSDAELYREIFGDAPTISDDRMLFDDFGSGRARAIYMRAEPSAEERARMLATPGLRRSAITVAVFESAGIARGFSWWEVRSCPDAAVHEANGFRGWRQFTLLDCPAQDKVYVIAVRF